MRFLGQMYPLVQDGCSLSERETNEVRTKAYHHVWLLPPAVSCAHGQMAADGVHRLSIRYWRDIGVAV